MPKIGYTKTVGSNEFENGHLTVGAAEGGDVMLFWSRPEHGKAVDRGVFYMKADEVSGFVHRLKAAAKATRSK